MLEITSEATGVVQALRTQRGLPDGCGLRMYANTDDGSNSQRAVRLGFVEEPIPGDAVAEQDGERIFVAPEVADMLDGRVLDADEIDGETKLVLHPA
jgi:Fe-S cluster assembly iron-binding protein IscA